MMNKYNYKHSINNIKKSIDNNEHNEVINFNDIISNNQNLEKDNIYHGGATFLHIRVTNYFELLRSMDAVTAAKLSKAFTNEVMSIIYDDKIMLETGLFDSGLYGIYSTASLNDEIEVFSKAVMVNTFVGLFNSLIKKEGYDSINVAIGIDISWTTMFQVVANNENTNKYAWIGNNGQKALDLTYVEHKIDKKYYGIAVSNDFYSFINEELEKQNNGEKWFFKNNNEILGDYYLADLVVVDYADWISESLKENK